jgi:4-hydroxythreonine-4-phosphate dehydrogenase
MADRQVLALSLGDPAGIGPELIAESWLRRDAAGLPPFVVAGGAGVLAAAARQRGLDLQLVEVADPAEGAALFATALPVIACGDAPYTPGQPDRAGAELALASLQAATALATSGAAQALVTSPIAKAELARIGFAFPGQTEFVADACGVAAEAAVMMLAGPSLRTVPMTVHCPLSEVPGRLSLDLIVARARVVDAAMRRDFGLAAPRLAICGLNPHAGENGRMGHEDAAIIAPAIAALQAMGIAASGPHPADSLFAPHARATYDVAIAMYHDQALIPIKALDFDEGVNVTLGLPVIRTSPDHGTAFGIAGQRQAHPGAMLAAIRMAGAMAARRAAA